jgi:hypothetical protein
MTWNKAGLFILNAATRQTRWSNGLIAMACGEREGMPNPVGRPRSKSRYLTEQFYVVMAKERGMTPKQVLRRSERRLHAFELVRGRRVKYGHGNYFKSIWGADNPFIESHAWKYLMRSALDEQATKRRNFNAKSKNATTEP